MQASRQTLVFFQVQQNIHGVVELVELIVAATVRGSPLLDLRLEAPVQLTLLIVHLTQNHVVFKEKLVAHAKPVERDKRQMISDYDVTK